MQTPPNAAGSAGRLRTALPMLALVAATGFWGSSFLTVATAVQSTDPFTLVLLRFTIGMLLVLATLRSRALRIPARTWRAGAICATAIYGGYLLNHIGLETLLSSVSGFLTALYVPITPFLFWAISGRKPGVAAFAGALAAFAGLALLAGPGALTLSAGLGEWLTIGGAFLSALEIILMGRFAPSCDARELAFTQLLFVALYALVGAAIARLSGIELTPTVVTPGLVFSIFWLAVILTCTQLLLAWGQKFVPPAQAAVVFALENVFAAVIGWAAGERLGLTGLAGGALIVAGIFITQAPGLIRERRRSAERR